MSTFKIVLDKRVKSKSGQYNLAVRVSDKKEVIYLNITKLTLEQYNTLFIKNSPDRQSIDFREKCFQFQLRAELLFKKVNPFNRKEFIDLFYSKEGNQIPVKKEILTLKDLFDDFLEKKDLKTNTLSRIRTSRNVFETFKSGLLITEIDTKLLSNFEKYKLKEGISISSISSYIRDLRNVVNYGINELGVFPEKYQYPFGRGQYSVKNHFPRKMVLSQIEIQSIIDFDEFKNEDQRYARDIWLFLYRCNGINFADFLRLKWTNRKGNYFIFLRKKTETTRKNNVKEIVVPINEKIEWIIEKYGKKDSPYIFGLIKEFYTEKSFVNRSHKLRQELNRDLDFLTDKLNLSVPLKLKTARDSYATSLKRAGVPTSQIGEMLGHSNSIVTEHYLGSLDMEKTMEINQYIL